MRRDHGMPALVKLGIGVGLGYALYRWLHPSAESGLGPGADAGPGMGGPSTAPERPRAPDVQPLEVRVRPSSDGTTTVIDVEGRIVSVGELIARIGEGGRRDVLVTIRGDTRHGDWQDIRDALEFAGVRIGLRQPSIAAPSSS